MSEEIEIIDHESGQVVSAPENAINLFGVADPVAVIEQASKVATALSDVVRARGLIARISNKDYPQVEAWTLLGSMLGVFPVTEWSRELKDEAGRVLGWEARVEARTRAGDIVGAAEAECRFSERRWKTADSYAVRSMAQTRATSKALRQPLGFVMQLAGLQATPADEMDGIVREETSTADTEAAQALHTATVKELRDLIEGSLKGLPGWDYPEVMESARRSFNKPRLANLSDLSVAELQAIITAAKGTLK